MRIYLDACAIIYLHEGQQNIRDAVAQWLAKASPDGEVMTPA